MSQVTITIDRHEAGLIADSLTDAAQDIEDIAGDGMSDAKAEGYSILLCRLSDMFRNAANSYDKEKGEFR